MELDVEVQAIAAPGATSITLELSPASEQLSTGAHDVATLPNVTAVSTSFGTCEAATSSGEAQSVEQLVLLGTPRGTGRGSPPPEIAERTTAAPGPLPRWTCRRTCRR